MIGKPRSATVPDSAPRPTAEDSHSRASLATSQSLLYMAPEAIAGMAFDALKLDRFLGAPSPTTCSRAVPATSIEELHQKCRLGHGLRISEVVDGAGRELQDFIQFSTCPAVEDRSATVREFLDLLENVEKEFATSAVEEVVNPLEARAEDRLAGGCGQHRPAGRPVPRLLVQRDGQEGVLVALDPSLNARVVKKASSYTRCATRTSSSLVTSLTSVVPRRCSWP